MHKIILLGIFQLLLTGILPAQQPIPIKPVRIADSLSPKERAERNPILSRQELDSLFRLYHPPVQEPGIDNPMASQKESSGHSLLLVIAGLLLILLTVTVLIWVRQRIIIRHIQPEKTLQPLDKSAMGSVSIRKTGRKNPVPLSPEEKLENLHAELNKLAKENEGLQSVIREYNGIRQDLDNISYAAQQAFKVKIYPGNEQQKKETAAIAAVLLTEKAVADYAYTQFLRPLLAITDANKNNPAKINSKDQERLFDLLISLSFLYIEYLYLRISDLSVGGTMVQRMQALTGGAAVKEEWLKKLNRESGSRALVMRMLLDKFSIHQLTYPVFDETNLNNA